MSEELNEIIELLLEVPEEQRKQMLIELNEMLPSLSDQTPEQAIIEIKNEVEKELGILCPSNITPIRQFKR